MKKKIRHLTINKGDICMERSTADQNVDRSPRQLLDASPVWSFDLSNYGHVSPCPDAHAHAHTRRHISSLSSSCSTTRAMSSSLQQCVLVLLTSSCHPGSQHWLSSISIGGCHIIANHQLIVLPPALSRLEHRQSPPAPISHQSQRRGRNIDDLPLVASPTRSPITV